MLKRVRWVSLGAVVGFGGSVWAQRKVKASVERYLPEQVGREVAGRARNLGLDVADALREGRDAMREREADLRHRVDSGRPPHRVIDATAAEIRPRRRHLRP